MSMINDTYETAMPCSTVGHSTVKLLGNLAGPIELTPPPEAKVKRQRAKAAVAARKAEVRSGAAFLRSLTTSQVGGE
jgi:hypothetical protein